MKLNSKSLALALTMALGLLFSPNAAAQSTCCGGEKHDEATCSVDHKKDAKASCGTAATNETTSGCLPSSCRGAKTKFGEAKVISNLRGDLVALKTKMEKSTTPRFDASSYDIHGIVGETDDESLQIIV